MNKNETNYKSLDIVNNDSRITKVFKDEDGIWLWLNPGWTCDKLSAHDGHEDTVSKILEVYKRIEKCNCEDCKK